MNGHEAKEESYSMYPKTSSPPAPVQTNIHFPMYQAPVQIYGYPQGSYMYAAGQAPNYPFGMMNQSQMMYQSALPPQGVGMPASKKKWNSSNPNNGSGATNTGGIKTHNYHHSTHASPYHSQSSASPYSSSNSNLSSTKGFQPSDPHKFDSAKLNSNSAIDSNISFPVFINTDEKLFKEAKIKRQQLRIKSMNSPTPISINSTESLSDRPNISSSNATHNSGTAASLETSAEPDLVSKPFRPNDIEPSASFSSNNSSKAALDENVKSQDTKQLSEPTTKSTSAPSNVKSPESTTENEPSDSVKSVPMKLPTPKAWSVIASSAMAKNNISVIKPAPITGNQSTVIHPPAKKDKKYIPPSTKVSEPLGTLCLRACYDPDFINYSLKTLNHDNRLAIKSITPRGIVNNANICFMSSVLQVLLYCRPFVDILNVLSSRNLSSRVGSSSVKLLDAYIAIYKQFDKEFVNKTQALSKDKKINGKMKADQRPQNSMAEAVKPDTFYKTLSTIPKFKDLQWGHQEDAEEFLTHLLDQLHEEMISSINCLTENEIQNMLNSISDEELKVFFIRNLSRYKDAEFIKNMTSSFKELLTKYASVNDDETREGEGWHEVSGSSKKGKKTKSAAKRTMEVPPSPITSLFGGQFRSVLDIPQNKESQSITLDPFQTIQLDISDPAVTNLESALQKFSQYELLPYKASSGNDVEAKKQTFIDKLPDVLIIQLKRFLFINNTDKDNVMTNYNAYNGRIEKILKRIDYTHELVIPKETVSSASLKSDENCRKYRLSGVIYHHGMSSDGGHYTADVYNDETQKWFRIDDVNISEIEKESILKGSEDGKDTRTAYILVYEKV